MAGKDVVTLNLATGTNSNRHQLAQEMLGRLHSEEATDAACTISTRLADPRCRR